MFEEIIDGATRRFGIAPSKVKQLLGALLGQIFDPRRGGAAAFVASFHDQGFGDVIDSWIGGGAKQEISVDQLRRVLGPGTLGTIAGELGLPLDGAGHAAVQMLPEAIGALVEEGRLPSALPERFTSWLGDAGGAPLVGVEVAGAANAAAGGVSVAKAGRGADAGTLAVAASIPKAGSFAGNAAVRRRGAGEWWPFAVVALVLGGAVLVALLVSEPARRPDVSAAAREVGGSLEDAGANAAESAREARGGLADAGAVAADTAGEIVDSVGDALADASNDSGAFANAARGGAVPERSLGTTLADAGADAAALGREAIGAVADAGAAAAGAARNVATDAVGGAAPAAADAVGDAVQRPTEAATDALGKFVDAGGAFAVGDLVDALNRMAIQFDLSSASISADSAAVLEQAAAAIEKAPVGTRIEIGGHTDTSGNAAANQALSEARAAAVAARLIALGVDAGMLTSRGYGQNRPIADNSTREGRAANRRIEFTVSE